MAPSVNPLSYNVGDGKPDSYDDEKEKVGVEVDSVDQDSILPENMLANGKERPIETANDMATR